MSYDWLYDEFRHRGTDYNNIKEVALYDEKMQRLRDINKEIVSIIDLTDLDGSKNVLEIGIGTGEFTVELSKHCSYIYGIDISQIMLDYAGKKAVERKRKNLKLIRSGFLSYEHEGDKIDIIVTQLAFHHLPDFWKAFALDKMYRLLEKGGRLFLHDVVFSFDIQNYERHINGFIEQAVKMHGGVIGEEIILHIKEEYSTFDWILESMIKRTGFTIYKTIKENDFFATYVCLK